MKNFRVLMKTTAVILSAATLYVVVLWQPKQNNYDKVESDLKSIEEQTTINSKDDSIKDNSDVEFEGVVDNNQKSESESLEVSSNISVLNISFESIVQSLSNEDKENIKKIVNKLSITDCNKVNSMLIQEDKEKGIAEAFKFMKKRLSKNDYDELQNIMKNYINFDAIENNV